MVIINAKIHLNSTGVLTTSLEPWLRSIIAVMALGVIGVKVPKVVVLGVAIGIPSTTSNDLSKYYVILNMFYMFHM